MTIRHRLFCNPMFQHYDLSSYALACALLMNAHLLKEHQAACSVLVALQRWPRLCLRMVLMPHVNFIALICGSHAFYGQPDHSSADSTVLADAESDAREACARVRNNWTHRPEADHLAREAWAKSRPPWKADRTPCLVTLASTRHSYSSCTLGNIFWSAEQGGTATEVCLRSVFKISCLF